MRKSLVLLLLLPACLAPVRRLYERRAYGSADTAGKDRVELRCDDANTLAEDPRVESVSSGVSLGEARCETSVCTWPVTSGSGSVEVSMRCGTEER